MRLRRTHLLSPLPATWRLVEACEYPTAEIGCPWCGALIDLERTHVVRPDGHVQPVVDCWSCEWSANVVLEEWIADA